MCSLMGHLGAVIVSHHCSFMRFASSLPRLLPSCLGLNNLWLFSPNIWHPSCFEHEDNPDNATKMNQPTSPSRRRLTPNLCPKPKPFLALIHSGPLHHRRGLRALNLQQHPRSPTASASQHVHHHSRLQPERRRC
jgi:hypothetical protein